MHGGKRVDNIHCWISDKTDVLIVIDFFKMTFLYASDEFSQYLGFSVKSIMNKELYRDVLFCFYL